MTGARCRYAKPVSGSVKKAIGSAAKTVGGLWWSEHTPEVARVALALPMGFFKALAFKKVRKACGLDRCALLYPRPRRNLLSERRRLRGVSTSSAAAPPEPASAE